MKKIFRSCCLGIVFFFALSSCRDVKDLQVTGVKGFKINKVNTEGIDGDILLSINNPNRYGFTLYKSSFDVSYSGVALGKARLDKKVKIRAGREETYAFRLSGDLSNVNILEVMKLLKGASFKNMLEVKGNLKAGKFFIRTNLPVDLKESIRLN